MPPRPDVESEIEQTRAAVTRALSAGPLRTVLDAMERVGVAGECDRLTAALTTVNGLRTRLEAVRTAVLTSSPADAGIFERVALLRQFAAALPRVPSLPVCDDVKRLFCDECRYILEPPRRAAFDVGKASFVAVCELATFRRFPAGQYHWMRSGLPRSWLLQVKGRERLVLLCWIAARLKGFAPAFVPHLNAHRRHRWLTELEADRSYYRMARSMELQPDVRGLVAASWLRSPDTHRVSPELAWMNRTIVENGGAVFTLGPADPDCGVFARSAARRQAYGAGTFTPTVGLVVWPRDAMLAWAARHSELGLPPAPQCSTGVDARAAAQEPARAGTERARG